MKKSESQSQYSLEETINMKEAVIREMRAKLDLINEKVVQNLQDMNMKLQIDDNCSIKNNKKIDFDYVINAIREWGV